MQINLQGFRCQQGMWQIPLVKTVMNNNIKTILCNHPPTKFLSNQPPPSEAIANVYKLKTQPELIRYYHAAAGFPTKPTWIMAIKKHRVINLQRMHVSYAGKSKPAV